MLVIRRRQIEALAAPRIDRFNQRMALFLRRNFSEKCGEMDDASLIKLIEVHSAEGRSFGLKTERELSMYLTLRVGLGSDLQESEDLAWARKILSDRTMEGTVRMGFIFKLLAQP